MEAALAYVAAEKSARKWQVLAALAGLISHTGIDMLHCQLRRTSLACRTEHVWTASKSEILESATQGLSRYRHIRELQAGSTAMVHLVEDKHSGKPCAVKLLERSSCDLGTAREVGGAPA